MFILIPDFSERASTEKETQRKLANSDDLKQNDPAQ